MSRRRQNRWVSLGGVVFSDLSLIEHEFENYDFYLAVEDLFIIYLETNEWVYAGLYIVVRCLSELSTNPNTSYDYLSKTFTN